MTHAEAVDRLIAAGLLYRLTVPPDSETVIVCALCQDHTGVHATDCSVLDRLKRLVS